MITEALKIVEILRNHGFEALFAGGCVRDRLMGIPFHDIDIATSATPDQIEALFPKTIPVGKSFGVIIVIENDIQFEVATFRTDGISSDGRHPDTVNFSSKEEDAKRRDLTINAMFYDPTADKILDFVNGQKDIESRIIRFVGNPRQRIEEDKLRMIRAIRFAARFDFDIDADTSTAIKEMAHLVTTISEERIAEEIIKILQLHKSRKAFDLLLNHNLLEHILPEVKTLIGVEQPVDFHPEGDVFQHTILALEQLSKDASPELLLGMLLHDIGKPATFKIAERIRFDGHDDRGVEIADRILKRLKFSNETIERVKALIANHMRFAHVKKMRVSKLKRFINMPFFDEHIAIHRADCLSSHGGLDNVDFVIEQRDSFPPEELKPPRIITGHDLIAMGFKQGPIFKKILTEIEDMQLENVIKTREEAIQKIKDNYGNELGHSSNQL
ncbi:MAG: CCA tRNA nucleotidyltransferase [Nitrosarchaeum sp.]|nr:CCA tRNA nucleotidyltransferase [Nitrosarchaeum sp.]